MALLHWVIVALIIGIPLGMAIFGIRRYRPPGK
jgi:hypothetical protein